MKVTQFLLITVTILFTYQCSPAQKQGQDANQQAEKQSSATQAPFENIDLATFKEKMDQEDVVLLDVRTPQEIAQGKIGNALEIDVLEPDFISKVKELDPNKTYLVYCKMGGRSSRACDIMAKEGFGKLYNLEGGYTAWVDR